jgi:hypothetical protein
MLVLVWRIKILERVRSSPKQDFTVKQLGALDLIRNLEDADGKRSTLLIGRGKYREQRKKNEVKMEETSKRLIYREE